MNTRRHRIPAPISVLRHLALSALLAILASVVVAADSPVTEGLVPGKVKGIDKAWQKPGIDLRTYKEVLLRPVSVAFSRNWHPRDYGPFGLKDTDVQRIRSTYAKVADEAFARVLSKDGYGIATKPGRNVLEIQAEIVDLYVNAPQDDDVLVRTYVRNAGDMRLLVTLRDSATGEVLFHGSDFQRGDDTGWLQRASSIYNRTEAERVFTGWARQLTRLMSDSAAAPN